MVTVGGEAGQPVLVALFFDNYGMGDWYFDAGERLQAGELVELGEKDGRIYQKRPPGHAL